MANLTRKNRSSYDGIEVLTQLKKSSFIIYFALSNPPIIVPTRELPEPNWTL